MLRWPFMMLMAGGALLGAALVSVVPARGQDAPAPAAAADPADANAHAAAEPAPVMTFAAYDIIIETPDPLAAYQVRISGVATMKLIGVEGGDHAVYAEPPHYDAALLAADTRADRIVLADYSLDDDLPSGRVRIARIHVAVMDGGEQVVPAVVLVAAGRADESRITEAVAVLSRVEQADGN